MDNIRLTSFSHGAGCGCKISPAVLESILAEKNPALPDPRLLVGNDTRDDAAVYDLGNGTAIVSTTDFFMPIVDDPAEFGAIASVNALSDVYAMGGKPLMALAILGWPVNELDPSVANAVLEGSREICRKAKIPMAGGHSIDNPEPLFGLSVTGLVKTPQVLQNSTARVGSSLFLTKPLGVGIMTTAAKRSLSNNAHLQLAKDSMLQLNQVGTLLGEQSYVNAMTDVTGFGLLGHLSEVCRGSNVSAHIHFDQVPRLPFLDDYIAKDCIPGGTNRNWASYGQGISPISEEQKALLADPQTSGGLLIAVDEGAEDQFLKDMEAQGMALSSFGRLVPREGHLISVF